MINKRRVIAFVMVVTLLFGNTVTTLAETDPGGGGGSVIYKPGGSGVKHPAGVTRCSSPAHQILPGIGKLVGIYMEIETTVLFNSNTSGMIVGNDLKDEGIREGDG